MWRVQVAAAKNNITQSMSRKGNCWDNAVAESFFKTLKAELFYGEKLLGAKETGMKIFDYVHTFYNRKRRHSALKYDSIDEFWNQLLKNELWCYFAIIHVFFKNVYQNFRDTNY